MPDRRDKGFRFGVCLRIHPDAEPELCRVASLRRGFSLSVPPDGESHTVIVSRDRHGPLELYLDGAKILVFEPWWRRPYWYPSVMLRRLLHGVLRYT